MTPEEFQAKSLPWQDGYMAYEELKNELLILEDINPYALITQWASHQDWISGWMAREEDR